MPCRCGAVQPHLFILNEFCIFKKRKASGSTWDISFCVCACVYVRADHPRVARAGGGTRGAKVGGFVSRGFLMVITLAACSGYNTNRRTRAQTHTRTRGRTHPTLTHTNKHKLTASRKHSCSDTDACNIIHNIMDDRARLRLHHTKGMRKCLHTHTHTLTNIKNFRYVCRATAVVTWKHFFFWDPTVHRFSFSPEGGIH